jgi:WD40 repeat protein
MLVDERTLAVTVFDADTDTVLGSVPIPPGESIGDVLITPDQTRGFVTTFSNVLIVIDLTTSPPRLAAGPNPIPISNPGEDLAISPDGKFLVVSDGGVPAPISVVDIARQAEIHTLSVGSDTNSIDVCSNGSVLATSFNDRTVHRLKINRAGVLRDTGEVLSLDSAANNVFCAPGGTSGLVIYGFPTAELTSFTIPGLHRVDTRELPGGYGNTGLVNVTGNRVFARITDESANTGFIDSFDYNAITAALGATPRFSIPVSVAPGYFGVDQLALHPNNAKLYVSERDSDAVKVYDANTGALLTAITDAHIDQPVGVTVAIPSTDICMGPPPDGAIVGTDGPDVLRGTPGNDVIFGLGGHDVIDGSGGDDLLCGGHGHDVIRGGSGDDIVNGGSGRDVISGGAGNDRLQGGSGNDTLLGGPGDDLIEAGASGDVLSVVDDVSGNDRVDGGSHVTGDRCLGDRGDAIRNCNP